MAMLKNLYMDLNMNQFDFLINGPEYEPQLVYRPTIKSQAAKSEILSLKEIFFKRMANNTRTSFLAT